MIILLTFFCESKPHSCDDDSATTTPGKLRDVYYKYRNMLNVSYHRLLSESRDLEELVQFALGFLILWLFMAIPDVVKLLDVDESSFNFLD